MVKHDLGRRFALFWAGESVSQIGTALSTLVLPVIAVTTLGAGPGPVALLLAMQWAPAAVLGVPLGAWVDRWGRHRRVLQGANVCSAVTLASLPVAYWAGVLGLGQLLLVALLLGLFGTAFQIASAPFLRSVVPPGEMGRAFSRLQVAGTLARVAGPGLAGIGLLVFSAPTMVLVDAASFLVATVCLGFVTTASTLPAAAAGVSLWAMIREGFSALAENEVLRTLVVVSALANLTLSGIGALEVPYLARVLDGSSSQIGAIVAVGAAGGVIGALGSVRLLERWGEVEAAWRPLLLTTPWGLLLVAPPAWHALVLFAVGLIALELGVTVATVAALTLRQSALPAELLGRVSGFMRTVQFATIPLGALIAGGLAQMVGTRPAMVVLVLANIMPSLLFLRERSAVRGQFEQLEPELGETG